MKVEDREELIRHLPALRAFALSLVRSPSGADDAVQDTLVKALTNFDKFERGLNMRAWLFTILRNTYYSSQRKTRRELNNLASVFMDATAIKPDHDGFLLVRDFLRAFDQLPDQQREVLMLVGASGFSYEEAAQMIGVPIGTIKSRINRARERLSGDLGLAEGRLDLADRVTLAVINQLS